MFKKLRLRNILHRFEDELQARIMRLLRLKGLLILIVIVGLGGYWLLQRHIDATFAELWADIKNQWELFSFSALIKGAAVWLRRMSIHWVTREIPKRLALGFILSYGVVYVMPLQSRIRFRDWAKRKKKLWFGRIKNLNTWLRRDDVFGPLAGWAIGGLITLILLVFFYSLFWFWMIIALGFIKMPASIAFATRWIGGKIGFALQKIPFGKGLGRFTHVFWAFIVRWLGKLRIWKPKTEEQKRKSRVRQIKIARTVIKQRQIREAAWDAFKVRLLVKKGAEVLRLQRELEAEQRIRRHAAWKSITRCERQGIPSLYKFEDIGNYRCCQHYSKFAGVPQLRTGHSMSCCELEIVSSAQQAAE